MQYISAAVILVVLFLIAWVFMAPYFNDSACVSIRHSSMAFREITWLIFRCP